MKDWSRKVCCTRTDIKGRVGFGHNPEAAAPHAVGVTAQQHAEQETKETQVPQKNHNVVNAYERI